LAIGQAAPPRAYRVWHRAASDTSVDANVIADPDWGRDTGLGTGHGTGDGTLDWGRDTGLGTGHWDGTPGLGRDTGTGTRDWDGTLGLGALGRVTFFWSYATFPIPDAGAGLIGLLLPKVIHLAREGLSALVKRPV